MIRVPDIQNRKVAVFGLGLTGIAMCEALAGSGAEVFAWDENEDARAKTDNTKYAAEHPKNWPWKELDFLALSPGVPLYAPKPHVIVRKARQEQTPIIGDVELFARAAAVAENPPKIVAVTGSNGKSTTTALIGHILKEAGFQVRVGGNIGAPLMALKPFEADAAYVLELSSFQLDLVETFHADIAILLNLSPDHLDRHGTMERYIEAKRRIFANQGPGDTAVIGVDDDHCQRICAAMTAGKAQTVIPVSSGGALGRGVFAIDAKLYCAIGDHSGEAGDISNAESLRGAHNWQNAAAALAAAVSLGVSPAVAVRSMERFRGLAHRIESVGRIGAVEFINDSKATNADATARALSAFGDIFWIAGGREKEGGVESLRTQMDRVRGVYLIGEAAKPFEGQLAGTAPCYKCGDLETAVSRAARDAAQSGLSAPVVLLSPACASYDQFRNFEERGETFRRLVAALADKKGAAA